jgi:hypothetical protein
MLEKDMENVSPNSRYPSEIQDEGHTSSLLQLYLYPVIGNIIVRQVGIRRENAISTFTDSVFRKLK